jgi:hypothetical protein
MQRMSAAIIELDQAGEHELASELLAIRERWAKAITKRAKAVVQPERLQQVGSAIESALLGQRPALRLIAPGVVRSEARELVEGMRREAEARDAG